MRLPRYFAFLRGCIEFFSCKYTQTTQRMVSYPPCVVAWLRGILFLLIRQVIDKF
jgi:hypothetical protein